MVPDDVSNDEAAADMNARIRTMLVRMLESLCLVARGRAYIQSDVGVTRMMRVLKDADARPRAAMCRVLGVTARFRDAATFLAGDGVVLAGLNSCFLNDSDDTVVAEALAALAKLSEVDRRVSAPTLAKMVSMCETESAAMCERVTQDSVLTDTLDTAEYRTQTRQSVQTQLHVLHALTNVCADATLKTLAIDAGVVGAIENAIAASGAFTQPHLHRLCAAALMGVTVEERGKTAVLQSQPLVDYLCDTAMHPATDAGLRSNVVRCIQNLSDDPMGLHRTGLLLIADVDALLSIIGTERASAVLAPLFTDPVYQTQALKGLTRLTSTPEGCRAAWACVEIVPTLARLMSQSRRRGVAVAAANNLTALCAGNAAASAQLCAIAATDPRVEAAVATLKNTALAKILRPVDAGSA
jgi:hypothetical protein